MTKNAQWHQLKNSVMISRTTEFSFIKSNITNAFRRCGYSNAAVHVPNPFNII